MNGRRESDRSVVPKEKKRPSNDTTAGAMGKETAKGRDLAAGNMDQPNAPRTQSRTRASLAMHLPSLCAFCSPHPMRVCAAPGCTMVTGASSTRPLRFPALRRWRWISVSYTHLTLPTSDLV